MIKYDFLFYFNFNSIYLLFVVGVMWLFVLVEGLGLEWNPIG